MRKGLATKRPVARASPKSGLFGPDTLPDMVDKRRSSAMWP